MFFLYKIKDSKAIIQEIIEEIRYFPDICGLVKASPFDSEKMEIKENGLISFIFSNFIFNLYNFFSLFLKKLIKFSFLLENSLMSSLF